jgi:hemoglobin
MGKELTLYEALGGEVVLGRLVDRFYAWMDAAPQFAGLRALHPEHLRDSREKLFSFLSGWLGGPDLFAEKYGHPRLRERHLPFVIGVTERDQWVACMMLAMEDIGVEEGLRAKLLVNFFNTADFMRNTPD